MYKLHVNEEMSGYLPEKLEIKTCVTCSLAKGLCFWVLAVHVTPVAVSGSGDVPSVFY